jgi:cell division topological specificity factor MinE
MFGLEKLFGSRRSNSVAKSRLSFVLVQDRAGLSAEDMGRFRNELTEVIERYFTMDKAAFEITYERSDDATKLVINSPVLVKRDKVRPLRTAGTNGRARTSSSASSSNTNAKKKPSTKKPAANA